MKIGLFVLAILFMLVIPNQSTSQDFQKRASRISDKYSLENVASYEVYQCSVSQHHMALIHLKSGETLPMLCKISEKGIIPIPQSVFTIGKKGTKWEIMCEPRIIKNGAITYLLMNPKVSIKSGILKINRKKAKLLSEKPMLLARDHS